MILGKDYINGHQEEKLYSTGDEMLDNLLERAFCEGYELGQREFGRTGLNAQQANQFFTKTNTKASKAIKNAALNKKMNGYLDYDFSTRKNVFVPGSPTANLGPNRRVAQGLGDSANLDYLNRNKGKASAIDLSINKKAGLATAGANTGNHFISESASNSMRYGNPLVRQNQGGTKAIIKESYGF